MEESNKNVIDKLYEVNEGKIEKQYEKKYGKLKEAEKTTLLREELSVFIGKFIKNEKDMNELNEKLNEYDLSMMATMTFWYKPYYKAGFLDAINLKEEIKGGLI